MQSGNTALLLAGWKGHPDIVKILLGAGARDIPNKVAKSRCQMLQIFIAGPASPLL